MPHRLLAVPILPIDDLELSYLDEGRGDPVVLLHGLGSSSLDWEGQLPALSGRYRVVAPDLRGCGRSRHRGPFSVSGFAGDVAALLDAVGEPAHVVGLSMGGMVALQLAVDRPDTVRTLTIVNSGPALVPTRWADHVRIAVRRGLARLAGPRGMARLLAPRLFPGPDQADARRTFAARMAANDRAAYIAIQDALIGWSVADRIAEIRAPVLVVAAEHDYTPPAAHRTWASRLPQAEVVVVAAARHALPVEAPERFNAVLLPFLDAH